MANMTSTNTTVADSTLSDEFRRALHELLEVGLVESQVDISTILSKLQDLMKDADDKQLEELAKIASEEHDPRISSHALLATHLWLRLYLSSRGDHYAERLLEDYWEAYASCLKIFDRKTQKPQETTILFGRGAIESRILLAVVASKRGSSDIPLQERCLNAYRQAYVKTVIMKKYESGTGETHCLTAIVMATSCLPVGKSTIGIEEAVYHANIVHELLDKLACNDHNPLPKEGVIADALWFMAGCSYTEAISRLVSEHDYTTVQNLAKSVLHRHDPFLFRLLQMVYYCFNGGSVWKYGPLKPDSNDWTLCQETGTAGQKKCLELARSVQATAALGQESSVIEHHSAT